MKRTDINRYFTGLVNLYLQDGYYFSDTMKGSSGEVMKVDVTNGKELVRFRQEYFTEHNRDEFFNTTEGIEVIVERWTEIPGGTVWNGEGEELHRRRYYSVDSNCYNATYFVDSLDEYKRVQAVQNERLMAKYRADRDKDVTSDSTKKLVISYIKRQPRCKTKKWNDIKAVYKRNDGTYRIQIYGTRTGYDTTYTLKANR